MANSGWGQGSSAEADTGILEVLLAFVSQGGMLYGARRWADNPLTLTHVRWQGQTGGMLDAFRQPGGAANDVESGVWVQLALHFPSAHPSAAGADAPWLPLAVEPAKASQWVQQLKQYRAQHRSRPPVSQQSSYQPDVSMPGGGSRPPEDAANPWQFRNGSGPGYSGYSDAVPLGYESNPSAPYSQASRISPVSPVSPMSPMSPPHYNTPPGYSNSQASQWTGEVPRSTLDGPEISVLPCIEVELPPLLDNQLATDYHRDFARDVAIHFRQAVQQLQQVREVRGWMRGDRLVLAARFAVGVGARTPSRAEMDSVAHVIADVLAQRTLPYARLSFADPGEWMQGRPLPES